MDLAQPMNLLSPLLPPVPNPFNLKNFTTSFLSMKIDYLITLITHHPFPLSHQPVSLPITPKTTLVEDFIAEIEMVMAEADIPQTEDVTHPTTILPIKTTPTLRDLLAKFVTSLAILHYNSIFTLTMPTNMTHPDLFQPTIPPHPPSLIPLGTLIVQPLTT